jgi:hypothetical protein
MLTWNRLEAISSKLEAWLTGAEFVLILKSFKPLASSECPPWLTA